MRRTLGLGQREYAELLKVPLESLRAWDSGRRPVPSPIVRRARDLVTSHRDATEALPLAQLARELHVHVRTLQAAARSGRLETQFSVRSVFGRPMRFATRSAGERFLKIHYRRTSSKAACVPPLVVVPDTYDDQLRALRARLRLTQAGLAQTIGAAGKAVVYQWEARKRTPSPVLWERVRELDQISR